jgi:hypothetical protein
MDVIDKLARKSKLMINLSNNDLQCDCQAIYFLQWMVKGASSKIPLNDRFISFKFVLDDTIYTCKDKNRPSVLFCKLSLEK